VLPAPRIASNKKGGHRRYMTIKYHQKNNQPTFPWGRLFFWVAIKIHD